MYHALLFLPLLLLGKNRRYRDTVGEGRAWPSLSEVLQIGGTFVLALFGWILFRAESLAHAVGYVKGMLTSSLFSMIYFPLDLHLSRFTAVTTCCFILVMFLFEWIHRERPHALSLRTPHLLVRHVVYIALLLIIYLFNAENPVGFIYFQF
jgi:preprotein translocase subunit SecG